MMNDQLDRAVVDVSSHQHEFFQPEEISLPTLGVVIHSSLFQSPTITVDVFHSTKSFVFF